jgi:hypothetical protein
MSRTVLSLTEQSEVRPRRCKDERHHERVVSVRGGEIITCSTCGCYLGWRDTEEPAQIKLTEESR